MFGDADSLSQTFAVSHEVFAVLNLHCQIGRAVLSKSYKIHHIPVCKAGPLTVSLTNRNIEQKRWKGLAELLLYVHAANNTTQ